MPRSASERFGLSYVELSVVVTNGPSPAGAGTPPRVRVGLREVRLTIRSERCGLHPCTVESVRGGGDPHIRFVTEVDYVGFLSLAIPKLSLQRESYH